MGDLDILQESLKPMNYTGTQNFASGLCCFMYHHSLLLVDFTHIRQGFSASDETHHLMYVGECIKYMHSDLIIYPQ